MSYKDKIKTEHNGAKNGGGYYGLRAVAKAVSKKLRRRGDLECLVEDEEQAEVEYLSNLAFAPGGIMEHWFGKQDDELNPFKASSSEKELIDKWNEDE